MYFACLRRSSNEYYSAPEYCSTFKKVVHEDYYLKKSSVKVVYGIAYTEM
jgi:hypothetical protein